MMNVLATVGLCLILAAGLVHVFIFLLESVLWRSRRTWRQFGIRSAEDAEVARPWAFNQGFYNLFLAAGAVGGAVGELVVGVGASIAAFSAACMVGAAVVLLASSRGAMLRAALLQGALPLLGLALVLLARLTP